MYRIYQAFFQHCHTQTLFLLVSSASSAPEPLRP